MAFVQDLQAAAAWVGWYILPFIFVMTAIVFFHELGHYLVGRWCGVKIDAFSLGFGPELCARVDKHGTRWRLAAFPVGGYVKFHGDANAASAPDHDGVAAMAPRRARADPRRPAARQSRRHRRGGSARQLRSRRGDLRRACSSSSAAPSRRRASARSSRVARRAGRLPGRRPRQGDQRRPIATFEDLQQATLLSTGLPMTLRRRSRREAKRASPPTPEIAVVDQGPLGKRRMGRLGLASTRDPADVQIRALRPAACVVWGAQETGFIIEATGAYVGGLFAGRETADNISGPLGVGQIAGEMAKVSLWQLLSLAGLFSVSVGLMNLLPVPLLDGGHLLYFAFEALRGRPLSERMQQIGMRIGIAFVAALVIFTTSHDILRLVGAPINP